MSNLDKWRKRQGYKKPSFALGQLVRTSDGRSWWVTLIDYQERRAAVARMTSDPFAQDETLSWVKLTPSLPLTFTPAESGTCDIGHTAVLLSREKATKLKEQLAAAGIPEAS